MTNAERSLPDEDPVRSLPLIVLFCPLLFVFENIFVTINFIAKIFREDKECRLLISWKLYVILNLNNEVIGLDEIFQFTDGSQIFVSAKPQCFKGLFEKKPERDSPK